MTEENYPRKGEYGSTETRCKWCGRSYNPSLVQTGPYCSFTCNAAGRLPLVVCSSLLTMPLALFLLDTYLRFSGVMPDPTGFLLLLGLVWIVEFVGLYAIYVGYRTRQQK